MVLMVAFVNGDYGYEHHEPLKAERGDVLLEVS
jgi:hypothetical protein